MNSAVQDLQSSPQKSDFKAQASHFQFLKPMKEPDARVPPVLLSVIEK